MFGFNWDSKRQEVRRVLTSRVNHNCLSNLDPRDRRFSRSAFSEVVWLIPIGRDGQPQWGFASPVVSKDISAQGLSLIHNEATVDDQLIVGLQDPTGPCFVLCTVEHCTSLGCGFYQIGLVPEQMVPISDANLKTVRERLAMFQVPCTPLAEAN